MSNLALQIPEPKPLRVITAPSPFQEAMEIYHMGPGQTVLELLREVEPNPWRRKQAIISINGEHVHPEMWASTIPRPGSLVVIRIWPSNRGVGAIFVALAALAVSLAVPAMAGIIWPTLGPTALGLMGGLAGMATGIVGTLALNALIPPAQSSRSAAQPALPMQTPAYNLSTNQDTPTQFVDGARNQLVKWGVIPCLSGYMRVVPFKLKSDVTESEGDKQFVRVLVGQHGPIEFSALKIGQTAWDNFTGITMDFHNGTLVLNAQTLAIDKDAKTITRSAGTWPSYGIQEGDTLTLGGCTTAANDGDYVIATVTDTVLTYSSGPATTTETGNGAQTVSVTHGDTPLTIADKNIHEDPEQLLLEYNTEVVRTCQTGATGISFDLTFPNGLFAGGSGSRSSYSVTFKVRQRLTDAGGGSPGPWVDLPDVVISGATSSAVRKGTSFTPLGDQIDLGIKRDTPADDLYHSSVSYWTAFRTFKAGSPISYPDPLFTVEVRIQASGQLNGTLDEFNFFGRSIFPDWDADSQTWITRPTNNPASLYRAVAQSQAAPKAYPDSRIDLNMLAYWHEYCVDKGWTYDRNIDQLTDWDSLLNGIAAAGRAGRTDVGGKLSVVLDETQTDPVTLFNYRVLKNLEVELLFPGLTLPHAFRCPFFNRNMDYQQDERIVLLDGYQIGGKDAWDNAASWVLSGSAVNVGGGVVGLPCAGHGFQSGYEVVIAGTDNYDGTYRVLSTSTANQINIIATYMTETFVGTETAAYPPATLFEELKLEGITDPDNIFKLARYHGAAAALRYRKITADLDLQHLVCTRGDLVLLAHDVIMAGLCGGRVKSVDMEIIGYTEDDPPEPIYSGLIAGVTVDEECPMQEGETYLIEFRVPGETPFSCQVVTEPGEQTSLTFETPLGPGNTSLAAGDLFTFGGSIRVVVTDIKRKSNMEATLIFQDEAPGIHQADVGTIPAHDSQITAPVAWWAPQVTDARSDGSVLLQAPDGSWLSRILLTLLWPSLLNSQIVGVEAQFWPTDSGATPVTLPVVPLDAGEISLMPVEDGIEYSYRLRYVKKDGSRGPWTATATHTVEGKTAPPNDVANVMVNQAEGVVTVEWPPVADKDVKKVGGYIVKWGPQGADYDAMEIANGEYKGTSFSTTKIPPGTWDFAVKAVDSSDNESVNDARKTFAVYEFYSILSQAEQAPLWAGTCTNCQRNPQTGNINPSSEAATIDEYFDMLASYCLHPPTEYSYEAPEVNLGTDQIARTWARVQSNLAPGEAGSIPPQLSVDYKLDGGAYDGFEDQSIGYFEGRYIKHKITHQSANGLRRLTAFQPVVDQAA